MSLLKTVGCQGTFMSAGFATSGNGCPNVESIGKPYGPGTNGAWIVIGAKPIEAGGTT